MKIILISTMILLTACAKSGGDAGSSPVSFTPNNRVAVNSNTGFSGHQYVEGNEVGKSMNACVLTAGKWDCTHPMTLCWSDPQMPIPGDFTIASDNSSVNLTGAFEPATNHGGEYVINSSGNSIVMEWFGEFEDDGVVVTVSSADGLHQCSELYFVGVQ